MDSLDGTVFDPSRVAETRLRAAQALFGEGERDRIGRFTTERVLGRGGMGVVYLAFDPDLDRRIALKLLRPSSARSGDSRARILREAQAMAQLSHPNVAAVHEVGVLEASVYLVMEYVDGPTLRQWLAQRPRAWREICAVFEAAGRGLVAAHERGLVHRDFKGDNVLIAADGSVKVVDFGLARAWNEGDSLEVTARTEEPASARSDASKLSSSLTRSGATVGTPRYMAPEQHMGRCPPAADQFALCVTLYEALYGTRPFPSHSMGALVLAKQRGDILPPPRGVRVPRWLRRLVLRGLRPHPEERFASMAALVEALGRFRRAPMRRIATGTTLLGAGAGIAIAATWTPSAPTCDDTEARVARVWNDDVRATIADAFEATGLEIAPAALERARRQIDGYVATWSELAAQTCNDQDAGRSLVRHCLDRRLTQLDRRLRILADADIEAVVSVDRLLPRAGGLHACVDPDGLRGTMALPDEDVRERVEAITSDLAVVEALADAQRHDEALERARALEELTADLSHLPLRAEILLRLGLLQQNAGDHATAHATLTEAVVVAERAGMDVLVAEGWLALARVFLDGTGEPERARDSVTIGEANAQRLDPVPAPLAARIETMRGRVARGRGDFEAAEQAFERALAIQEANPDASPVDIAYTLTDLGRTAGSMSNVDEAARRLEEAKSLLAATVGDDHPLVATMHVERGIVFARQGKLEEAEHHISTGVAALTAVYGDTHAAVASQLHNLGNIAWIAGRPEDAERYYRRAADSLERTLGPAHERTARSHSGLATALNEQGRHADALALLDRTIPVMEDLYGEEYYSLGRALVRRADALIGLGRHGDAVASARRGVDVLRSTFGDDHVETVIARAALGDALERAGEPSEALVVLERALRGRLGASAAAYVRGRCWFARARALSAVGGDETEIQSLLDDAAEAFADTHRDRDHDAVVAWRERLASSASGALP